MRIESRTAQVLIHLAVIAAVIVALATVRPASPAPTFANPQAAPAPSQPAEERVSVDAGPPSIPADGSFTILTEVRVDEPTPYLEIRLQIRRPAGQLLFQRTEVHSDVETGTVTAEFERELEDLSLAPDAYPYEIRVRTEVGEVREQRVDGLLLIHAADHAVTPVSMVVRVAEPPGFDPAGHFAIDPADSMGTLEQVALLAGAVLDDADLRATLGLPGMTLNGWRRAAEGYTLSSPEGLIEVGSDEDVPRTFAAAIRLVGEAVATGRLELLDIPYADPDIGMLASTESLLDLGTHYEQSRTAYLSAFETSPSAGTAVSGDALPPGALEVLNSRAIEWTIVDPDSVTAGESTPTAGVWAIEGTPVQALVIDRELSGSLSSPEDPQRLLHLFEHSISEEATTPLVATVEIGPGRTGSVERLLSYSTLMNQLPWTELVTASEAAETALQGTVVAPARVAQRAPSPEGYEADVVDARRHAIALESALGVNDPDSQQVTEASLIAQSARWAGPDGMWSQADRGRAFAASSVRTASGILELVSLTASDVTLAGSRGDLPLSIVNGSAKELSVKLVMRSDGLDLPSGTRESLLLRPQENLHTVSVDLRSSLSARIDIELWAGELLLDSATSTVRASYIDRIAIVGGAVVLLLGLLVFIRKRVRTSDAGTIR